MTPSNARANFRDAAAALAAAAVGVAPHPPVVAAARRVRGAAGDASASPSTLDAALGSLSVAFGGDMGAGRLASVERVAARVAAAGLCGGGGDENGQDDAAMPDAPSTTHQLSPEDAVALSTSVRRAAALLGVPSAATGAATAAAAASAAAALRAALPPNLDSTPLVPRASVPPSAASTLADVGAALAAEYGLRRRLLAGRAAVTLRSLLASPRLAADPSAAAAASQVGEAAIAALQAAVEGVGEVPIEVDSLFDVTVGDVLSAGAPTCSVGDGATTPGSALKKITVGPVPDRGGRVGDARGGAGPAFAPRVAGGGGRGGGGSRVKGKRHKK